MLSAQSKIGLPVWLSCIALLMISSSLCASEYSSSYDEPIKYNKRYVTEPSKVITDALISRGWEVKEQRPGMVVGWLNDYKNYEIILEINYTDSQIGFRHVSARKLRCGKKKRRKSCKLNDRHYDKWRLYIRKSIAMNIHKLALGELLANPTIKESWLSTLKRGSLNERTKMARNIIDLEFYQADALQVIEGEVSKRYSAADISKHEVQQLAFYCKALARSKNTAYLPLLQQVVKKTKSKSLKKYVKGYIKANFPQQSAAE